MGEYMINRVKPGAPAQVAKQEILEKGFEFRTVKPRVLARVTRLERKPLETSHILGTLTAEDLHILMGLQRRKDLGVMRLEALLKKRGLADELWV